MKNIKKKVFVSIATIALVSSAFSAGIMAQTALEKIQAFKDNAVSFKVDGKTWVPLDAKGKKLSPIRYNDTLYLPVAAIGKATGFTYKYDNKTQIVELSASGKGNNPSASTTATVTPKATPAPVEYANPSKLTLDMFTENYNKAKESNASAINRSDFTLGNYPKSSMKIYDYKYTPMNSTTSFVFAAFTDPETGELLQINPTIKGPYTKEIMRSFLSGMLGGPVNADEFIQKNSFYTEINRGDAATPKVFSYKSYKISHYRSFETDSFDALSIYTAAPPQK
ncbi:hypothetical protein [Paenibacillus odorifer]|uniref:hypothetical protein n=1 Tax=Paenibacillus odorifer TaxID=189426 RepID=UPI00096D2D6D|nr:hypothetical protein [Paenibacillus odorifer]OMD61036.1 hypothetical protein BSK55_06770 [Paenibacillus odorifer]